MNKITKMLIICCILIIGACIFQEPLYANSMQRLEFKVSLQKDGSGIVKENRQMNLTEDTEIYIVMENLGGSEISDFKVSDFGVPLEFKPEWDIYASREEKAGKYGIVVTEKGSELCWGIGEYGDHEYEVSYTISGMVRQLKDGQALNWKFFEGTGNINPKEFYITIEGPEAFTDENTRIWGFGFAGEIWLKEGKLEAYSSKALQENNHITVLMQFAGKPFQPSLGLENTLAEQEAIAKENSSYSEKDRVFSFVDSIVAFLTVIMLGLSSLIVLYVLFRRRNVIKKARPVINGKERRKRNKDKYYREIPYREGAITDIAYLLEKIERGRIEDYFNSFLLKWMKDGYIEHLIEEKGLIFKKETSVIRLQRGQIDGEDPESRMWNMMQSASGSDNILEEKEFSKWAQKNYKIIDELKKNLSMYSLDLMVRRGYLEQKDIRVLAFINTTVISCTDNGEQLFDNIVQFENYLKDFSLLNERVAREVHLWEELLIWASLFGIAEEVAQQFEELYPQYTQESRYTHSDLLMMSIFTSSFARGYQSGIRSASYGGGGFTSLGGGGGSFGGGGGGSR